MDDRAAQLQTLVDEHDLLAVYLFGSRADDGLALLEGRSVEADGSDLDVGVVMRTPPTPRRVLRTFGPLEADLSELFAPLDVDLVLLQRLDPLFQYEAIQGHRIAMTDEIAQSYYELAVMRQAAELLPIQRRLERDRFGAPAS